MTKIRFDGNYQDVIMDLASKKWNIVEVLGGENHIASIIAEADGEIKNFLTGKEKK